MRKTASFPVDNILLCKQQMLNWANQFGICCFMDSSGYSDRYSRFDCLAGAGAVQLFAPQNAKLAALKSFTQECNDWLFGHIAYDMKNEIESLTSAHTDKLLFPDLFFFQPEVVLCLTGNVLKIESLSVEPSAVYAQLQGTAPALKGQTATGIEIKSRISRQQYLDVVAALQQHILRGDCYEINFCQEFFAEDVTVNALLLYQNLSQVSPAPFAAYYKLNGKYALCASPERYIQKKGTRLLSQPVKGTIRRDKTDAAADNLLKQQLFNSPKDRIENVMITDLVRNDLSRIGRRGSVAVDELFGIYTYPQVHQMISTISSEVDKEVNIADVLQATFPMGSMTGAPKRIVMELTEQYERSKRGLYAGSIGYLTPANDFDFNVVIRSVLYNQASRYLSFHTGGAITFNSRAEEEYNECLLKAEAMMKAVANH